MLDGLKTVSPETARALAAFKGEQLTLNGLETLSADAALTIASRKGRFRMLGLTALPADVARVLADCRRWDGQLPGVTAFDAADSVAVATALASRKGGLSLPNLKRISPRTLTALIQKEDVRIPPLDALELIREPDGGPSEDFVIPDGFLERQKRR